MKVIIKTFKYPLILISCQLCGMLFMYYKIDFVGYIIAGIIEGIIGTLIANKKI